MTGLVIVANRLPVEVSADGSTSASPGGLASALSSITAEGAHWVGWAGPAAGRRPAFDYGNMQLHPVSLSKLDIERYYAGFANSILWPLFHGRLRTVDMNRVWWRSYKLVNQQFAEAVAKIAPLGATVWVHDYHLLLAPAIIRSKRPDLRIGFFLHIPFPNAQLFASLPWRRELITGMLGADLLGFQVPEDVANFEASAERVLDTQLAGRAARRRLRSVVIDSFPISVDYGHWEELGARAEAAAEDLRAELGVDHVFLGIDRLDYTKGIVQRLTAFGELLDEGLLESADCAFVQVAVPSRSDIAAYQDERAEVEMLVSRINTRHARPDRSVPVVHIDGSLDEERLAAWYRAADTLVVTSLSDGMNLVAKEFVAARGDLRGSLVLSEFTGAAADLEGAIIVNPFDVDAIRQALLTAVSMTVTEQADRLKTMRASVHDRDVHSWARRFLSRLRSITRGRVADSPVRPVISAAVIGKLP